MKKTIMAIFVTAILSMVSGCGSNVDRVKGSTLGEPWNATTVGNAFNAFFDEPKWEEKESANKTKFVEFTGKAKKEILLNDEAFVVIPKGAPVMVQFVIKDGGKNFKVEYIEAPLGLSSTLSKEVAEQMKLAIGLSALAGKTINLDGKTAQGLTEEGLVGFLNAVYKG